MTGAPPQRRPQGETNTPKSNTRHSDTTTTLSRRSLFSFAAGACSLLLINKPASAARLLVPEKRLFITRTHAGETFNGVFWVAGQYDPDALARIKRLLRDPNDHANPHIDTALVELMARMQRTLDTRHPLDVVSGYRSPRTNAMARRTDRRVAKNSFHMQGKAVDIRVSGYSLSQLRRAALSLQAGGVGTYPRRDFLHIDVGPVRNWG
jgi:uncharacterized protein YcbK (DUF882 family)